MSSTPGREEIYRKTTRGILYNLGGKNLGFILSFIFTIIIARELGPSDYGGYSFYRNSAAFLALFTILGMDLTLNHFVPELTRSGERKELGPLISRSLRTCFLGLGVVGAISSVAFYLIPHVSGYWDPLEPEILVLFLLLIMVISFSSVFKGVMGGFFLQRFLNIIETLAITLRLTLTLMLLHLGLGLEGVLMAVIVSYSLPSIIYYLKYRKVVDGLDISKGFRDDEFTAPPIANHTRDVEIRSQVEGRWKEMQKYSLVMMLFSASFIMLDNQLDIIMLRLMSSEQEAGFYNIAYRFAFISAMVFIGAIDGLLVPMFTSLKNEKIDHQRQGLRTSLKYTLFFLVPATVGGIVFSEELVEVFFGSEYSNSGQMLSILYLTLVLSMAISWPIRFLLMSIGRERDLLRIYLKFGIVNVVGNLILIPYFDGLGAVIATGATAWLITTNLIYLTWKAGMLNFPLRFLGKCGLSAIVAILPFVTIIEITASIPFLIFSYVALGFVYLGLIILLGGIRRDDLNKLWLMVRSP